MAEPFGLYVRFILKDGASDAFDQLVAETATQIRASEPGTLIYACHAVEGRPRERAFYELYRDRAAFEEHERQPHIKRFLAARTQYLADHQVDFLMLAGGKGIPAHGGLA